MNMQTEYTTDNDSDMPMDMSTSISPHLQVVFNILSWVLAFVVVSLLLPLLSTPLSCVFYTAVGFNTVVTPSVMMGLLCLMRKHNVQMYLGFALLLACPVTWFTVLTPGVMITKLPSILSALSCFSELTENVTQCLVDFQTEKFLFKPIVSETFDIVHKMSMNDTDLEQHLVTTKCVIYAFVFLPLVIRAMHITGLLSFAHHFTAVTVGTIHLIDIIIFTESSFSIFTQQGREWRPYTNTYIVYAMLTIVAPLSTPVTLASYMISSKGMKSPQNLDVSAVDLTEGTTVKCVDVEKKVEDGNCPSDPILATKKYLDSESLEQRQTVNKPIDKTYLIIGSLLCLIGVDIPLLIFRTLWMIHLDELSPIGTVFLFKNAAMIFLITPFLFCWLNRFPAQKKTDTFMAEFADSLYDWLRSRCSCKRNIGYACSVILCVFVVGMVLVILATITVLIC